MRTRRPFSALQLLCSFLFFFCSYVFAASAVLGIDLGTEYIKASLVKPGIPLEIVLTKDSRRKETSAVAFKPPQGGPKSKAYPERIYGSDAMALAARFPGDVYPNLKTLLGLPVEGNDVVQDYAARHPALKLGSDARRKTAVFKSTGAFTADEPAWLVEELLAMELQNIRQNAELLAGADTTVRSVVITVPPFYTADEKRAVQLAADLAGLRVLSLISDGLAVGLNYATSRQFPDVNAEPEVHMVFDMGAGSTKATVLKFQSRTVKDVGKINKTVQEVQVLGSGWDRTLGGDTLNALIVDDMIAQFVDSSAAKAASVATDSLRSHGRAVAKLSKEAERIRHVLSANTNTAASIEGLYDDVDFRYKISRADFETMAAAQADRVTAAVQQALDMAGLQVSDLNSIILHGGATRTPFVQRRLEQIVGSAEKLRSNVNSDEAAVFGAGFRAADLSPSFRVKEIRVADGASYSAGMAWTNSKTQKLQQQQLWIPTSHLGAAPKEVTLPIKDDSAIDFYQLLPSEYGDSLQVPTALLTTRNLTATVAQLGIKYRCDPGTIQVKIGLLLRDADGEVETTKVTAECEGEHPEKEGIMDGVKNLFGFGKTADQKPIAEGEGADEDASVSSSTDATLSVTVSSAGASSSSSSTTTSTTSSVTSSTSADVSGAAGEKTNSSEHPKKTTVSIPIQFELEKKGIPQLAKADVQTLKDRLKAFEISDRVRRQREETFNKLEAFTYKIRSRIDSDDFVTASTDSERVALETMSQETSDWLYGDGADATRDALKKKHNALKALVDPIEARIIETEKRPELLKGLKAALTQSRMFIKSARGSIAEYDSSHASIPTPAMPAASPSTVTSGNDDDNAFAGLEDDDAPADAATSAEAAGANDDQPLKGRGLVPPMYTLEDLKEYEELCKLVSAWLDEQEAAQAKLGPQDDPVLRIKDMQARQEQLEKVGLDLAMKGVRNLESKQKGKSKSKGKKSSKTSKTATTSTGVPTEDDSIKHEEL